MIIVVRKGVSVSIRNVFLNQLVCGHFDLLGSTIKALRLYGFNVA